MVSKAAHRCAARQRRRVEGELAEPAAVRHIEEDVAPRHGSSHQRRLGAVQTPVMVEHPLGGVGIGEQQRMDCGVAAPLRLGISRDIASGRFTDSLRRFRQSGPQDSLIVESGSDARLLSTLHAGGLDLALVPAETTGSTADILWREDVQLVLPSRFPCWWSVSVCRTPPCWG
ncbi:LysR substrate-binding domain-containing protein [Azospirillum doebereinerae]|nr:LysR substrate-binding domain-containing protein [Azospirillum doebereinerae]MCG5244278.1 LysR substrate-binding domain-containing protein [Azospirillum doebereinerae]